MVGIGFFAPLPIALFIPFMASQSLAMGEAFGKGFQFGKRKISAMPNEEFNALTAQQMHIDMSAEIKDMIPSMKQSMQNFSTLQPEIIKQLLDYALSVGEAVIEKGTEVVGETLERASQFDYLKSFTDFLTQQGAANEASTLLLLRQSGLAASAHGAPPPSNVLIQTPDTSTQIKLQNEIKSLQEKSSKNPNISRTVIDGNIKTTYDNQGRIVSVNIIDQSKVKTAQSSRAQTIVKTFTKTKPRAPKSIVTQVKKMLENERALRFRMNQPRVRSSDKARIRKQIQTSANQRIALASAYDFS